MPRQFDDDPVGAALEFGLLIRTAGHGIPSKAHVAWAKANGVTHPQAFVGPAMSKSHLLMLLERGRDQEQVRKVLDRVFLRLEAEHLIEPWAKDGNLTTPYRVVSPLGVELLEQGRYTEYLMGLPEVVRRWRDSVVKLYDVDDAGIGTGFIVGDTTIATARHVLDGLNNLEVALEDGTVLEVVDVRRPSVDWLDVGIVEVRSIPGNLRPLTFARDPDLLEEVVVLGYPPVPRTDDAYLVVNRGEISSKVAFREGHQGLVVSCLLRGGNSGGPALNRRGQVVGLVSENLFNYLSPDETSINEGLAFAALIPSEWIQDVLDGKV